MIASQNAEHLSVYFTPFFSPGQERIHEISANEIEAFGRSTRSVRSASLRIKQHEARGSFYDQKQIQNHGGNAEEKTAPLGKQAKKGDHKQRADQKDVPELQKNKRRPANVTSLQQQTGNDQVGKADQDPRQERKKSNPEAGFIFLQQLKQKKLDQQSADQMEKGQQEQFQKPHSGLRSTNCNQYISFLTEVKSSGED
ncbi:MAG: hypothetical protein IKH34_02335 [Oscillospiraceae bacterium]|nr:hypothetical protein [Oscillospiraceae bacterium]